MAYYDIWGNPLGVVYDIHGNTFYQKPTSAVTNLDYSVPSTAFFSNADQQLGVMKAKYQTSDEKAVPLFIGTDHHGTGLDVHRWFSNNNDICAVDLQLGDVCTDVYGESTLTTMKERMSPVTNYIGILGNHDVKQTSEIPTQEKIRDYFAWNNSYRCEVIDTDVNASYAVYDDVHGIKFICCDWYTKIGENANGTMPYPHTTTAVTDWFLNELTANDGYDIIVLQHALFTDTYLKPDGTGQSSPDAPAGMERLWEVMKDRKNKRSGTYVDDDGMSHVYNFTGCTGDLICTLHGHSHELLYLREEGLSSLSFENWWTVTHALIDRTGGKFHLWMNDYDSVSEEYVYDL